MYNTPTCTRTRTHTSLCLCTRLCLWLCVLLISLGSIRLESQAILRTSRSVPLSAQVENGSACGTFTLAQYRPRYEEQIALCMRVLQLSLRDIFNLSKLKGNVNFIFHRTTYLITYGYYFGIIKAHSHTSAQATSHICECTLTSLRYESKSSNAS